MSRIAYLFPGQGAQFVGMGQSLIERHEGARSLFARASDVLGYDLAARCLAGPAETLNTTAVSQPAIFVASLAAFEAWRDEHAELATGCVAAAGLSLGEYTALTAAGGLDFEAAVSVVQVRGEAMQEASDRCPSGMISVLGLADDQLEALCEEVREEGEVLRVANRLCPGNRVVSGSLDACRRLGERAVAAGAMKAIPLTVAGAFHTVLMQPAVDRLAEKLAETPIRDLNVPVVSNVDGRPHQDAAEIRELLIRQVVEPVEWEASIRWLLEQPIDSFYEIGPGRVLRGLLKRIDRKAACESVPA